MGLAHHIGYSKFFQIHGNQHGGRQIFSDGDDGAVEIGCAQSPQHLLVLRVSRHSVGHIVCHLIDKIAANVHGKHFTAQLTELTRDLCAKATQTNYNICFHPYPP